MPPKAQIYYYSLTDEMRKEEKLEWFRTSKLSDLPFETVRPDKNNNWINLADNDWEKLIPLYDKEKGQLRIFEFSSLGVSTNRDEWVYDINEKTLSGKIQYFIISYNSLLDNNDSSWPEKIKWSRDLKKKFQQKRKIQFNDELLKLVCYRPFSKFFWYSEKVLNDILTQNHFDIFGLSLFNENHCITFSGPASSKPFQVLGVHNIWSLDLLEKTQCLPLYRYDPSGNRTDNITGWGLEQFRSHYPQDNMSKEDIFHYTYAVLHDPAYRKKYELNLKREFPRLPFYGNFRRWAEWGRRLMDLHLNYEQAEPYPLELVTADTKSEVRKQKELVTLAEEKEALYTRTPRIRVKLKALKEKGIIELDELSFLKGVPPEAWEYRLGNRSALEWVLDQYKEKKPSDPTIAEKFNTYRFADYKDRVISLLKKVCTVSVETVRIMTEMQQAENA